MLCIFGAGDIGISVSGHTVVIQVVEGYRARRGSRLVVKVCRVPKN